MSRTLTSGVTVSSEAEESRPIELYIAYLDDFTLYAAQNDTDVWFYDLDGNAQLYTAIAVSRGDIRQNVDMQVDTVTVSLDNVNQIMSGYIVDNDFRGRRMVVLKVFSDYLDNSADYVTIFDGLMDKPVLTEMQMAVTVVSRLGTLNLQAPRRMYQVACNWEFGSTECNYDFYTTGVSGQTATSGTTTIFWDSNRAEADDYWKWGEVEWTAAGGGGNTGEKRKIVVSSGTKFIMDYALPADINPGDVYTMHRGCPKTWLWCSGLDNLIDFGGFNTIPHEMVIRG